MGRILKKDLMISEKLFKNILEEVSGLRKKNHHESHRSKIGMWMEFSLRGVLGL